MKKVKLFFVLFTLTLVISIVGLPFRGVGVYALGDFEENGIIYELQENGNYTVIGCNNCDDEIVIPSEVNGKKVTKIKSFNNSNVKVIYLPNTIQKIEAYAFANNCSLDKVVLPDELEVIENNTFSNCCRLRTVELPANLKSIEDLAFSRCYLLKSITIPNKVEAINKSAFTYCHILKDIFVSDENNNFKVLADGSLLDINKGETIVHVNRKDLLEKEKMAERFTCIYSSKYSSSKC